MQWLGEMAGVLGSLRGFGSAGGLLLAMAMVVYTLRRSSSETQDNTQKRQERAADRDAKVAEREYERAERERARADREEMRADTWRQATWWRDTALHKMRHAWIAEQQRVVAWVEGLKHRLPKDNDEVTAVVASMPPLDFQDIDPIPPVVEEERDVALYGKQMNKQRGGSNGEE